MIGIVRYVLQLDADMGLWQQLGGAFGPFDQYQRVRADDVFPSNACQLAHMLETKKIQMKHARSRRPVLVHERERRTRRRFAYAISATDRLHERSLAGAKLARDRDAQRRTGRAAERFAPSHELVQR